MSASDYLENEVADHLLGTAAWTAPTNVYVQLHTGDPGEAGTAKRGHRNDPEGRVVRRGVRWCGSDRRRSRMDRRGRVRGLHPLLVVGCIVRRQLHRHRDHHRERRDGR